MGNVRKMILVLMMLLICRLPVFAATGVITVAVPTGGSLTLYRVGELSQEGSITLTGSFARSGIPVTSTHSPDSAQLLAEFAQMEKLQGITKKLDGEGKAIFSDLEEGLYLVVQTQTPEDYLPITPFLFQIPEERYYAIEASPKIQTRPDETQPESTTPETGDHAAVLLLPAAAAVLFSAAGLILCIRQRKHRRP